MTHGLQIYNNQGETVLDTETGESLLYTGSSNIASAGSDYPETNWAGNQLILARPRYSTYVNKTISRYSWGGHWALAQTGAAPQLVWRELRTQSQDGLNPTGYGLLIYKSTGTSSSDIILSATDLDSTAIVVATGKFNGTDGSSGNEGFYYEFTMDSNLDKGRYYVLATNTQSQFAPGIRGSTAYQIHINYRFNYSAGTIRVQNYFVTNQDTASASSTIESRNYDWAIFYVRNGGSEDDNF